jgi:hypothetical protein
VPPAYSAAARNQAAADSTAVARPPRDRNALRKRGFATRFAVQFLDIAVNEAQRFRCRMAGDRNEGGFTMGTKSGRLTGVLGVGILGGAIWAAGAQADTVKVERLHEAWQTAIAQKPLPAKGCFTASYPAVVWRQVACTKAPNRLYLPRGAGVGPIVGNFNDYAAVTNQVTSAATGSFPVVSGLTSVSGPNIYSLQLNSNFMTGSQACAGAAVRSSCKAWQQFVYGSFEQTAFMQYWLINYNAPCPAGWSSFVVGGGNDCVKNSSAALVGFGSAIPITDLPNIRLKGSAQAGGSDTLMLIDGLQSWGVTGDDNVVFLANRWRGTEFNVLGDSNGEEALFNSGTSLTVKIAVETAAIAKPKCEANGGTSGETNNLNLGTCTASKAKPHALPHVQFVESLP